MTDKEALIEILRGAVFGLIVIGGTVLFAVGTSLVNSKPTEKFKVVDTYKGCDIVRYTDPSNDYRYFLDCRNTNELDNQSRS